MAAAIFVSCSSADADRGSAVLSPSTALTASAMSGSGPAGTTIRGFASKTITPAQTFDFFAFRQASTVLASCARYDCIDVDTSTT